MITPLERLRQMDPALARRITVDAGGCWIYGGAPSSTGHCQVKRDGVRMQVHRRTYQLLIDPELPIRPGTGSDSQLDHTCRVRSCCNPHHLQPVTNRENSVRGLNGIRGSHRSKFVGVLWSNANHKWMAKTLIAGRTHHLGLFMDGASAAAAYDSAAALLRSTPPNFVHQAGPKPTRSDIRDAWRRLNRHRIITTTIDEAMSFIDSLDHTVAA